MLNDPRHPLNRGNRIAELRGRVNDTRAALERNRGQITEPDWEEALERAERRLADELASRRRADHPNEG